MTPARLAAEQIQSALRQRGMFHTSPLHGAEDVFTTDSIEEVIVDAYRLQPISTAPRDGTWILLFGPSGYSTTPLRAEVGRYAPDYRPLNPWQTHSNDAFTDGGPEPTHWMPLPTLP